MARIKIDLPEHFVFHCTIPVRITDINYGGHVGNDSLLSLLHEARMQYFRSMGYTELQFAGTGMIMTGVQISFLSELFYGDSITAWIRATNVTRVGFDLVYKLETTRGGTEEKTIPVAVALTSMVCYDYANKKVSPIPEEARPLLLSA